MGCSQVASSLGDTTRFFTSQETENGSSATAPMGLLSVYKVVVFLPRDSKNEIKGPVHLSRLGEVI